MTAAKSSSLFPSRPMDGQQDSLWEDEEEEEDVDLALVQRAPAETRPQEGRVNPRGAPRGRAMDAAAGQQAWIVRVFLIVDFH